jgi:hypothetical protein
VPANYVPEASVMRRAQTLPGIIGRKEMRRRFCKSDVKYLCSTEEMHWKLQELRKREVSGIPGGAVKCVDIGRNTRGEGGSLAFF